MTATPFTRRFGALLGRNGNNPPPPEAFSGQDEEPEATRTDRKTGTEPVAPTHRTKASRRRYSDEEKRRILRLVDTCTQRGQIGAILRREGIYYSTLRLFQLQRDNGLLDEGARSTKKSQDDQTAALANKVAQLERENKRLTNKLEKAEIVIDFQKKLSRLFALDNQDPTP